LAPRARGRVRFAAGTAARRHTSVRRGARRPVRTGTHRRHHPDRARHGAIQPAPRAPPSAVPPPARAPDSVRRGDRVMRANRVPVRRLIALSASDWRRLVGASVLEITVFTAMRVLPLTSIRRMAMTPGWLARTCVRLAFGRRDEHRTVWAIEA